MTTTSVARSSLAKRRQRRKAGAVVGSVILLIVVAAVSRSDRRQFMERMSFWRQKENTTEGRITIKRPVEKVFEFYRDFKNFPRFLGDVVAVDESGPATSRWTIDGPLGIQAHWTIRLTEERRNELIRYETVSSPVLKTSWEVYFATGSAASETDVREVMKAPLGRLGRAALALIGKFPTEEQSSNLRRLKEVLETGRVSDTSYAIKGKFDERRRTPD